MKLMQLKTGAAVLNIPLIERDCNVLINNIYLLQQILIKVNNIMQLIMTTIEIFPLDLIYKLKLFKH